MGYTLEEILEKIDEKMPSLSPTASKVIQLVNDMNCSPMQLTKVIKLDPVLSAKVLKLVNSSYFGLSKSITALERAIIMLGLNTIKNLALSAAVLSQFESKTSKYAFNLDDFWKHSLGVGVAAKILASKRGIPKKVIEDYFMAGLIHDLGLLVENNFYPEEMDVIARQAPEMGLLEVENKELNNLNHCIIGKAVGEKWNLSPDLIQVLHMHHDTPIVGENFEFILTIYLANVICKNNNIGLVIDKTPIEIQPFVYETLGLDANVETELLSILEEEISKAMEFLKV